MSPSCPRCTHSMRFLSESAGNPKVERYQCDKCKVLCRIELEYDYFGDERKTTDETAEPYCTCPDDYPQHMGHHPDCNSQRVADETGGSQ